MEKKTKGRLEQVLSIFSQAEYDKRGQTAQVLKVLENQKVPRKPAEIAGLTGFKQPSVRRTIQSLVQAGKVKRNPNNRYSIIK